MLLNPLKELKRRLEDDTIPLPKRLCLAKNVVQSHHFPTAPKERVIAEWLDTLIRKNELSGQDLKNVLEWLTITEDISIELKIKLIKVVSQYLQRNPLQQEDINHITTFLENDKMSTQLSTQTDDYVLIIITLLQNLKNDDDLNITLCEKLLGNILKYYKESKKKLDFILKFLDGENLETIFSFLNTDCRASVIDACQNILFPMTKKSFFIKFLQTLIVQDNIDELVSEKGDNIQSVIKIMSTFFTFPKGRTKKDQKFLKDFIDVFVSSFRNESQIIFAFYVMVANSLNMEQSYLVPEMRMPPIIFEENDEKIKRTLFFSMLEVLLINEVDITVRLTESFGDKVSKVEIKKNFINLLQAVLMTQLKLTGKPDKTTFKIIKIALNLDPTLIESKLNTILPPLMAVKKTNPSLVEAYTEMLNCLIETLFKLSRGIPFLNQILPSVKLQLETDNTEQFELKQKLKESSDDIEKAKISNKIINGTDLFPEETVNLYGKLTTELMFRQNKDLLLLIQKDLEEHCLMMLEEGFVSPSIITLTEVLSSILSSFCRYNRMADHTVPTQIAEDFWNTFEKFDNESLAKFAKCIVQLRFNAQLVEAFLKLCLDFSHLKLFNIKYGITKITIPKECDTSDIYDFSFILPCLNQVMKQWSEMVATHDDIALIVDELLLAKAMFIELISRKQNTDSKKIVSPINTYLVKRISSNTNIINKNYYSKVLFANLESNQYKQLAKPLLKMCLNEDSSILNHDSVAYNRPLLNLLLLETLKNVLKVLGSTDDLVKSMSKTKFDVVTFVKNNNIKEYFEQVTLANEDDDDIPKYIEILKKLKIYYLKEDYQLIAILVLLLLKKCVQNKKVKRNIDFILHSIFEVSPKCPDVYKIFPVDFIFSFKDETLLGLLTLKVKSNPMFVLKRILESGVKKIKTDSDVVKNIVKLLISKNIKKNTDISSTEYFKDSVFQISCIVLPIIAKEKRAITLSAYRSILADLQEKLHKDMLEAFENIDFGNNTSLFLEDTGNTDDSMVVSDSVVAAMNSMAAFSLTLSKYCETTDSEEIKNLDCLWSGLEFFVRNAIKSIQNPSTKNQHIESSLQLLISILRYIKKLDAHPIFNEKDKLFAQIWQSIKARCLIIYGESAKKTRSSEQHLENMAIVLKFICELTSIDCFANTFVADMTALAELKIPVLIIKEDESSNSTITAHKTAKYLWDQCLKANIIGPKCIAMTKLMLQSCRNLQAFIQQHYEIDQCCRNEKNKTTTLVENEMDYENALKIVKVDERICELLRVDLDTLSIAILAAKKINLDFKFIDAIFELIHLVQYIAGVDTTYTKCDITLSSFFILSEGCISVLNSILLSREQLLEDRWPNYMQCYRSLILCICERSSSSLQLDKQVEEKMAEIAHNVEKLTQSISKRKTHVSHISTYTIADICSSLEKSSPARTIRQHLENSVSLLIQAASNNYSVPFLKRALAGSPGHITVTQMYTMYKRYHKYVGNA